MKTQVIKKDGHYYIPYLEQIEFDIEEFSIEIDDNLLNKKTPQKNSGHELTEMKKVLGSSKLLEMILDNVPKDFKYKCSGKTDQELWYEERKNKYE